MKMRTVKSPKPSTPFKRALELIKGTNEVPFGSPVQMKGEADAYLVYQNYRELTNALVKYERQKAEIVELFRRNFL
jgi:hypothetical protein